MAVHPGPGATPGVGGVDKAVDVNAAVDVAAIDIRPVNGVRMPKHDIAWFGVDRNRIIEGKAGLGQ